jgi:hypothetical protein
MIFTHSVITPMLALGSSDPGKRLQAAQHLSRQLSNPGYLETLRQHKLTPLLYQTLTSFPRKEVGNVPLFGELRRDYLSQLRRYRIQEKETHQLVEVLDAAGVDVIFLKGADICHRLYDDPATRPMADVDIFISPADLERTRNALTHQGYRLAPWDLDPQPGFNTRFDYDITFLSPSGALPIDLHWEIRQVGTYYRLPYTPLRNRAVSWDLRGLSASLLAPEHVLMHLCLHSFDELESASILKIVDLDRALSRWPLDWDLFMKDAVRFGIQGPVSWIFIKMARLRPGVIPGAVLEQLAAYRPGWMEKYILRRELAGLLLASVAALWRYLPVRVWPEFLKGKLWPNSAYLKANPKQFGSRTGYLRHLLKRAQAKT